MEIVYNQVPPNYKDIVKAFGFTVKDKPGIVFTYGHKLFIPIGLPPDKHLLKHEETHALQQTAMGIEEWWRKYLSDPNFRVLQEIEAYRAQYRTMGALSLSNRIGYLDHMAKDLAGPIYGNLFKNKEEAKRVITDGIILKRPRKKLFRIDPRKLKKRQRQNRKKGRR